jgi:FtsP/CotA-like multicopper oxidase with cupredoxin domain
MAGALVVEDDIEVLKPYETRLMVIKDIALSGSAPEPHSSLMDYTHGKEGDTVMVNGQVNPVLDIKPGQVQRWRVLNACNARFLKLGLEGHALHVIGTEGGLLDKPYPLSSILLSPGERLDILVKASGTAKNYRLLSLPYNRGGGSSGQQVTLMTLSYKGAPANDAVPSVINPEAVRISPLIAKTERIVLSMGQGRGYVNGISFTMENHYSLHSRLGGYELWEIVNQSGMDHPFHQHVNACQVVSIYGGDSGYASFLTKTPSWKDVVVIPKWGSVKMLVPVMDYPGMAMFHCHIIEHEDIGMMGIWDIMEEDMMM